MKIVTLEDNVSVPAMPPMPSGNSWGGVMARPTQPTNIMTQAQPVVYAPVVKPCGCGSCGRCRKRSEWGAETPTFNITVSPTITANGGQGGNAHTTSRATNAGSVTSPVDEVPATAPTPTQTPEPSVRIIERQLPPEIVERTKFVPVPVRQVVERIKREPLFMPFKTETPVDRNVPMPVKVTTPVDRTVPIPVKVVTPVDRAVPIPVRSDNTPTVNDNVEPYTKSGVPVAIAIAGLAAAAWAIFTKTKG